MNEEERDKEENDEINSEKLNDQGYEEKPESNC